MRAMILGAAGQLARCLRDERPGGVDAVFLTRKQLDLAALARDSSPLVQAVEQRPAFIINAAAYTAVDRAETEPDMAFAANGDGPGVLAALCAGRGVPLVHVSTDYVFDGRKPSPYGEDDAAAPVNIYGASKFAGEQAIQAAEGRFLIFRTSWLYSAHGGNFVKTMLRLGAERDRLRVVDDQRGRPTSAHDLARALWAAAIESAGWPAASPRWGVYHYAGEGVASWADFADEIFTQAQRWTGRAPVVERIGSHAYPTPAARPLNSVLDCTKYERVFRPAPPPWRRSLSEALIRIFEEGRQ